MSGVFHDDKNIFNSHYGAIFLASKEIIKENTLFGNGLRSYRVITCDTESRNDIIKKLKTIQIMQNLSVLLIHIILF